MSLFNTLAHEGTLSTKVLSRRGLMTVVGAALLFTLGVFFITDSRDDSRVAVNTVTNSLTQEEFIRLNTTALDALVPAVVVESQMDVDPFLYWNTTGLEYSQTRYSEPESGPR